MILDRKYLKDKLGREPVIGFTCSTFDLFHAGHVVMLMESKELCDYLIVGLLVDPTKDRPSKNKPIQSVMERYIQNYQHLIMKVKNMKLLNHAL